MKFFPSCIAIFLASTFATFAFAQTTLRSESDFGLSKMLTFKGVAEDLSLSRDQSESLWGLWSDVELKLEEAFRDYNANFSSRLSPPELATLQGDLKAAIEDVRAYEKERIEDVMSASQIDRLQQIQYQMIQRKGSAGLKHLKDDLKLTQDQISSLEKLKKERAVEVTKLRTDSQVERLTKNEMREELQKIADQFEERLLAVLTTEQQQRLKTLQGKKFELQVGTPNPAKVTK